jgi:RimJ/RimL family protein N-acetyltransferase
VAGLALPDPPLADAVVALRGWQAADVPSAIMGFADSTVQRFSWMGTAPYTEADAYGFFAHQDQARHRGEELNLAFNDPGDPRAVLGGGSIYGIDLEQGRATVGYWLTPAARGRGIATHATLLMARWAFATLAIARLELTCGPDNVASQRVAERCGFTREGVLRSYIPFKGGRRDTVMFSLLAGELGELADGAELP